LDVSFSCAVQAIVNGSRRRTIRVRRRCCILIIDRSE